jgi:putative SOS response-associated peptidase YedK
MSGYYEWQDAPVGKQPWYFTARDGSPLLTAAGLWDEWKNRETGERLESCTMIVTEPSDFAAEIHDRMPVFLTSEVHAVAKRGGGRWNSKARAERFSATLAGVEAGQ